MRHFLQRFAFSTVALFGLAGVCAAQIAATAPDSPKAKDEKPEAKADPNRPQPTLVGAWVATSVTLLPPDGKRKTLSNEECSAFHMIVSEKTLATFVHGETLADMTYVADAKQKPCAIDLQSKDGALLGIYQMDADALKIAINDAARGRPKDFGKSSNGMNLVLKRMEGSALFTINIDGSDLRQIFWRPEYRRCSTPVWSPDGSKIAFSVLRFGVGIQPERIAVMDASGENLKELGAGISPSWSPDGKRIAFSAIGPDNQGVCIMNADGTNVKSVDPQGWSASWSPKGDVLAYIKHEDANPKLCIYDLNTWKHSALLNKPYQQINCLPAWSPDAQWICFKGILPEGNEELAVVHAEGQEKGFRILFPGPAMADAQRIDRAFGWQAKPENRILASVAAPDSHRTFVLRLIDPEGKTPMQRIAGQDAIRSRKDANFSPDGKKIIFSGPSKGFSMLQ